MIDPVLTSVPKFPSGWFTLHFGLAGYVVAPRLASLADLVETTDQIVTDWDDWSVWGEGHTPDATWQVVHCQIVTPFLRDLPRLRRQVEERLRADLVPVETGDDSYVLTPISLAADWAAQQQIEDLLLQQIDLVDEV